MSGITPWFVLSYPRSRTAWVSAYLTGCGVPCLHEGWKVAKDATALRRYLESLGTETVGNSDCSNIFFLDEILGEFPNAKFIKIEHDLKRVEQSLMESYGVHDYAEMFTAYHRAFEKISIAPDVTVDCRSWGAEESRRLAQSVTGTPPPDWWVSTMHGMLVQLMPEQIALDTARSQVGQFQHIAKHMGRYVWV